MSNFSSEQGQLQTESKIVTSSKQSYIISLLLQQENAPQGAISKDFKTALYVCLCTKDHLMEEALASRNMMMLNFILASVGYNGATVQLDECLSAVKELINKGLVEHLTTGAGFVSPAFKIECVCQLHARSSIIHPKREEHPVSYIIQKLPNSNMTNVQLCVKYEKTDCPVFSRFIVLPGDEAKVVINGLTHVASIEKIVTARRILICKAIGKDSVCCNEKGLSHIHLRVVGNKSKNVLHKNDLIICEIVDRKSYNELFVCLREVVEELGSLDNYIRRSVLEHSLPAAWPENVLESLDKIPDVVSKEEIKGRVDLRKIPLVTIDSEDARDFDDAVYCKKEGDRYHLYVAIADVSYYVRPNSPLDNEAENRGNSVYFPYFVIPMLPKKLSNGICSLNPNVDRLCMVCEMFVTKKGKIEDYTFYPAVMNSHARLTYTEAHEMLMNDKALVKEHTKCIPWVKDLYEMYMCLKQARDGRGAFEFESPEMRFMFDEKWSVCGLTPDMRDESHMIIEECMIAANICAATFVKEHQHETLYRVHSAPMPERIDKLRDILGLYGVSLGGGESPTPLDFRNVAAQVAKLPENIRPVLSLQLLRAMSKAVYDPVNIGHFGLALDNYAHFTSPIRRYPDLQLHRVIKFILERKKDHAWGNIGARNYTKPELLKLGIHTSEREKAAADAEFDVENSLKCEYVGKFVGKVVDGIVSTITPHMAFITLNDFFIDGALLIPSNNNSSHGSTPTAFTLPYIKSGAFRVGSPISVLIEQVDPLTRRINLVASATTMSRSRKGNKKTFDVHQRKKELEQLEIKSPVVDNTDKEAFFDRLKDISHGVPPEEDRMSMRQGVDFNLDEFFAHAGLSYKDEKSAKDSLDEKKDKKAEASTAEVKKSKHKEKKQKEPKQAEKAVAETEQNVEPAVVAPAPVLVKVKRKGNKTEKKVIVGSSLPEQNISGNGTQTEVKVALEKDDFLQDTVSRIDADLVRKTHGSVKKGHVAETSEGQAHTGKKKKSKANAKSQMKIFDDDDMLLRLTPVDHNEAVVPAPVLTQRSLAEGELKVQPAHKRLDRKALAQMVSTIAVETAMTVDAPTETVMKKKPKLVATNQDIIVEDAVYAETLKKTAKRKPKVKKPVPVAETAAEERVQQQGSEAVVVETSSEEKKTTSHTSKVKAKIEVVEPIVEEVKTETEEKPEIEEKPVAEKEVPEKPKRRCKTKATVEDASLEEQQVKDSAVNESVAEKPKRKRRTAAQKEAEAVASIEASTKEEVVEPKATIESKPKRRSSAKAKAEASVEKADETSIEQEAALVSVKPKRGRKAKVEVITSASAEVKTEDAEVTEEKPKRKRRTKAQIEADAAKAAAEKAEQEQVETVVAKPKRTRKAKVESVEGEAEESLVTPKKKRSPKTTKE